MQAPKSRKFGETPAWSKEGPTSLRNYDYRAEAWCAERSHDRGGVHPTIQRGTPGFDLWFQYFARHLGGLPWAMQQLCDEKTMTMTVPEASPQWFDQTFAPDLAYVVRMPSRNSDGPYIGRNRANVYVPADNALFPQMVDRARNADSGDYFYDQERSGIWVARGWLERDDPKHTKFKRLTADDLRAIYAKDDARHEPVTP